MIIAGKADKRQVIDVLSECFENNKTVNWIVKQDAKRKERINSLLGYSFDACADAGQVYLNDDKTGAVICQFSHARLPVLEEAYLTAWFILRVSGITGIGKTLRREKYIKQFHPADEEFIYIWFIGVRRSEQGKGIGAALLQNIISKSNQEGIAVYVETSVDRNLAFYKKHGFAEYHVSPEDMFGFKLYFLKRLPDGK